MRMINADNSANMAEVLRSVARPVREITDYVRNNDTSSVPTGQVEVLDQCLTNLQRVRESIDPSTYEAVLTSVEDLKVCIEKHSGQAASTYFTAPRRRSISGRGRPSVVIEIEQLELLCHQGFSAKKIAKLLGCSYDVVRKHLKNYDLSRKNRFDRISDSALDDATRTIHSSFPNAGCEMVNGLLKQRGVVVQRERIRSSLRRTDPSATAERWSRTISRSVPTPNCLWHIDGHMKLIRWGLVTHGCIDGYSRMVMYLLSGDNNRAETVLNLYVQACHQYIPSRVRSDYGGENVDVALFMALLKPDTLSHITGKSVHNERIERLWRDVFLQVIQPFYSKFYSMEGHCLLDPDKDAHIYALQYVFIPVINERLYVFRHGWNKHRVRTARNCSPEQLWTIGMLRNHNSQH